MESRKPSELELKKFGHKGAYYGDSVAEGSVILNGSHVTFTVVVELGRDNEPTGNVKLVDNKYAPILGKTVASVLSKLVRRLVSKM